jgi:nifR3 family TIM-barrel protein
VQESYKSERNRDVPLARPGEFAPVSIGPFRIDPPVVLAPMAGVTNWPFRVLCRRFGGARARSRDATDCHGLYVSEMITARPLVEGIEKTLRLTDFGPDETPRSLQLYGVDPYYVGEAVKRLVGEGRVDHIDMNFGCPVPKVTRRGGGSAIPAKPRLLAAIVRAAVTNAGRVPVTIKFRKGIDESLITYEDAGRVGEAEGVAAVALHARTAAQLYDGFADWSAIARLKEVVRTIPVFGNGDIWEAHDALRMMRTTGCDGVVVGRGCLGRPWLFRDLADVFAGIEPADPPNFGQVADVMLEHAALLGYWLGDGPAMRTFRKHSSWYTKGFRGSAELRKRLMQVTSVSELARILETIDRDEPFPESAMSVIRGKTGGTQRVVLPEGFLETRLWDATPPTCSDEVSGG